MRNLIILVPSTQHQQQGDLQGSEVSSRSECCLLSIVSAALEATSDNLQLCNAAEALGMPIYVQYIVSYYTRLARNNEISYKIIDIVSNMDSKPGRTIFAEIVRTLGIASVEGRMPDSDGFTAYLASNARFHDVITAVQVKQ
jgi:hypothetical protein